MSWEEVLATGRGSLRYRLMIEGWPVEFVTNRSITAATNLDGRTVLPALSYKGLRRKSRVLPTDGKLEASGNTFRIVPTKGQVSATSAEDDVIAVLGVYPEPVGALAANLNETGTTWNLAAGSFSDGDVAHLGTEAVRITNAEGGTIVRTIWDTLPQQHNIGTGSNKTRSVYIYDTPLTMEGRRAYLYAYGEHDDPDGDGHPIWRGIVNRPPRSASDGTAWLIECLPITHVLQQQVGGGTTTAKPIGIYHHAGGCFAFQLEYNGDFSSRYTHVGLNTTEQLIDAVNVLLASALAELGPPTEIDYCRLALIDGHFEIEFHVNGSDPTNLLFGFHGGSYICGFASSSEGVYRPPLAQRAFGGFVRAGVAGTLSSNRTYRFALEWSKVCPRTDYQFAGAPAVPVGYSGNTTFEAPSSVPFFGNSSFFQTTDATHPAWRIYVDEDLTPLTSVSIPDLYDSAVEFDVIGSGTQTIAGFGVGGAAGDVNYLDLRARQGDPRWASGKAVWELRCAAFAFYGILGKDSVVRASRGAIEGSVVSLRNALVARSIYANDGTAPFVTDNDLSNDWDIGDAVQNTDVALRVWEFLKPHTLEEVLAEELKLAAHFPRLNLDGSIGIAPLELVTDAQLVDDDHLLDKLTIRTPDGESGAWPQVEPQGNGIITTLSIQQWFDPQQDDWIDDPVVIQDATAIATHKNRGNRKLEIKPFSKPKTAPLDIDLHGFSSASAERLLRFGSTDYMIVTVKVPFNRFAVVCGDRVRLTHRLIPNGSGSRGVTLRTGIVIGDDWDLDPASNEYGELTVWMQAGSISGYAPGAFITGHSNTSGDTWAITCSIADATNILLSTDGDGKILKHFAPGDFIRIVPMNLLSAAALTVTGVVSDSPAPDPDAGTITVDLDGTWDAGSWGIWRLEFQVNDGSNRTTSQEKYSDVAGNLLQLPDGRFARRLQ